MSVEEGDVREGRYLNPNVLLGKKEGSRSEGKRDGWRERDRMGSHSLPRQLSNCLKNLTNMTPSFVLYSLHIAHRSSNCAYGLKQAAFDTV